ncbi:MAG: hypothetical protein DRN61_05210 [Thaumarchaeota archaeon]|nr:MAG: hypothetical protein DRN61_05210 [Nitrososphaerota archaeon]
MVEKPKSIDDLRRILSRLLGISEDKLPFEFYKRDGELVAHQNGYIPSYDDWFKIYNYARQVGRAEQSEEDQSWYFIFPKPEAEGATSPGAPEEPEEPKEAKEEVEEKEYDLRDSIKKVGRLYPVLVDAHGNIIDGYHRLAADPNWPVHKVEEIKDPVQLTIARLVANVCRREVPAEEKTKWLRQIAELTGWTPKQIAENLPVSYRWVMKYFPDELKDQEMKRRGEISAVARRAARTKMYMPAEEKPSIPCDRCGKLVTTPVHIKGKFYCEECARKVLEKKLAKPPLSKSIVQEALEKTLFNIYPEGVELERIREKLEEYDTSNLSDLLLELMRNGVIFLHNGRWRPREEYEKRQAVLEELRAKAREAEQILIDKYDGFDQNRGLETYKVSEIREIAKRNGPTEKFLEDLRRCLEAHKELYRTLHGQETFSPIKGDSSTENIDKIDRWLQRAKPVKLPGGPVEMRPRCPICGRGLTKSAYERLRRKFSHLKELWE